MYFKQLFIGVKWNGHDWVHLSSGQPATGDFQWCHGNPQGKIIYILLLVLNNFTFSVQQCNANRTNN